MPTPSKDLGRFVLSINASSGTSFARVMARQVIFKEEIAAALGRSTFFDEHRIQIEAEDGTVTLSGHVGSMAERAEAERIAWAAVGVARVNNRLIVMP